MPQIKTQDFSQICKKLDDERLVQAVVLTDPFKDFGVRATHGLCDSVRNVPWCHMHQREIQDQHCQQQHDGIEQPSGRDA